MKIRELRGKRALSLRDLEEASGVSYATISRMELGKSSPHGRTIRKLAAALGVPVEELTTVEETAS